jgi:trans-aconitate 2-methyltransferase
LECRPVPDVRKREDAARSCIDIGCGPGNSTELLAARFPEARVAGIDQSPNMVEAARKRLPGLDFQVADLQTFEPRQACDLIFANAVLQWVPHHASLLARLASFLTRGGCLAVQMPNNTDEPSHRLMKEVAREGAWAGALSAAASARSAIGSFDDYYTWLLRAGCSVDLWQTTYVHPLDGPAAIVEWFKSTGLKPYLDPLGPDLQAGYLARYAAEIARAYPVQADGTVLLRFPRLFFVAKRH